MEDLDGLRHQQSISLTKQKGGRSNSAIVSFKLNTESETKDHIKDWDKERRTDRNKLNKQIKHNILKSSRK